VASPAAHPPVKDARIADATEQLLVRFGTARKPA
jgi:hypothetical protein